MITSLYTSYYKKNGSTIKEKMFLKELGEGLGAKCVTEDAKWV